MKRLAAILAAGSALGAAAPALAGPGHHVLPTDHPVVALHRQVHGEVSRVPGLGRVLLPPVPIEVDTLGSGAYSALGGNSAHSSSEGPSIVYGQDNRLAALVNLARMASGRKRAPRVLYGSQPWVLGTVIHETLHNTRHAGVSTWLTMTPAQRSVEEGVVEAVSVDLIPSVAWRIFGRRAYFRPSEAGYPQCTALIRKASVRATGTGWPSHAARVWRREFLTLTPAQRETTLRDGLVAFETNGCGTWKLVSR